MTTTRSSSTLHAPDSTALVTGATSGIGRTTPAGRVTAPEEIAAAHLAA